MNSTELPAVAGPVERGVRRQLTGFELRRDLWCEAVGVQRSRAQQTAVLKWLPRYSALAGFDHTGVYYWPGGKLHFLLTEPYHSTKEALLSLRRLAAERSKDFSFVVGATGAGLWYPGACIPLLVAADGEDYELQCFAAGLPTAADFAA
jgi:hypothetical protein